MIPDYYERLGIDPGASPAEIESALKKKQPAWSMGTRNPKTRHANQLFLDEIPALRAALLSGPMARAAYDAELDAAQVARRESALDELHKLVRLRAAKGGLTESDRDLLRQEARRLSLDHQALDRLMQPFPSMATTGSKAVDPDLDDGAPVDVLDPSTRRQIRMALDHLDRRDLYDALGLFRDAPLALIASRADEERRRWMRKAQVTAEKTAWLEVVSLSQTHLGDPKSRSRYDRTLALEAEERFEELASFTFRGLSRVDPGTHAALVDEAGSRGIAPDRAKQLIRRSARKAGAGLGGDAASADPSASRSSRPPGYKLMRCRNCGGVTDLPPTARNATSARCKHCGASLRWECPVCRRSNFVDAPKCRCGFRLSLREALVAQFAAALHAFRCHDLTAARRHLEEVQRYAPEHVGARNGMARIAEREQAIDALRAGFEQAEAGMRLVEAARTLAAWRKIVLPGSIEIAAAHDRIAERLRKAEALASKARRLERIDPAEARRLYARSLNLAVDLPTAIEGRRRCPPDAPANLHARVVMGGVRLTWRPPEPDGLAAPRFVVLRKSGGLPEHPADGVRIGESDSAEFLDRSVEPGETVSYAVISRRDDAESLAAVAAGPIVYLPDVRNLQAQTRDAEIILTWEPPSGVAEIRVVRNEQGVPRNPKDGERIQAALDSATDRSLVDGRVYHYGVFAVYRDSDGHRFPASGATISVAASPPVTPTGPPRTMLDVAGRVRIEWVEPPRGVVRLRRTAGPLPQPPGSLLALHEVEATAGEWIEPQGPGVADDHDPIGDVGRFYTPLTTVDGHLLVGRGAWVSRLLDPTGLRAERLEPTTGAPDVARIQLRWNWPEEARSVRIAARRGVPPSGPEDPEALLTDVSRSEYERAGGWILNAQAPVESTEGTVSNPWHVRVYGRDETREPVQFSPGAEPSAAVVAPGPHPEITVLYHCKRPWFPGRPWTITVRTEPPGATIPPLVVVANARTVPIGVDDGEIVARLPGSRDGDSLPIPSPPSISEDGLRAFLDPACAPDALIPVRIRHPETGRARL